MFVQPYLHFNGRCEEAIEFYRKALGAEVPCMMRFNDNPDTQYKAMITPETANKVMHASIRIRDTDIMLSDGCADGSAMKFEGFSLALNASNVDDANKLFAALAEGGQVQQPLVEAFFADAFGMVSDKFGLSWMVVAPKKQSA